MTGGPFAADGKPDWRHFASLGKGHYRPLLAGIFATIVRSALLMAATFSIARLVTSGNSEIRWLYALAAVLCTIATGLISYWARVVTIHAVKRVIADLRRKLVACTLALPSPVVAEHGGARLRHILAQDSERLDHMCSALLGVIIPALVTAAAILLLLILVAPALGAIAALLGGSLLILRGRSSHVTRKLAQDAQEAVEQLDSGMSLMLRRHELAKSSAGEAFEYAERSDQIGHAAARTTGIARALARHAESEGTQAALVVLSLIVALILVPREMLSIETLAPAMFLLVALRSALQSALYSSRDISGAVPALVRVQSVLAMKGGAPSVADGPPPRAWAIEARDIVFGYDGKRLLGGIDLRLAGGEVAVLSGPNGSGKTTLLNILLGLLEPQSGVVRVDGIDLRHNDQQAFRRGIGYVPQNPILFPGTIAENIAYAAPDMDRDVIRWAAELTGVAAFADARPDGLDTPLGDEGAPLSGGQRQRVAMARALARYPRLLILDEPTNHLDAAGVRELLDLFRTLPHAPAVLVVSHDPAILAGADRHYALADGRRSASGAGAVVRSVA